MADWQQLLDRWTNAALIDSDTAARIRAYEAAHTRSARLRWPAVLAVAFGSLLLGAGLLLFVSAHWDEISPAARMVLVLVMVAAFHIGGGFAAPRFENMAIALHTTGTVALGAGIALTGQIFHLDTHWPAGVFLWALGAVLGWLILRHWTQSALAAILIPYWLCGEWHEAMRDLGVYFSAPIVSGLFLLGITYLTSGRRALVWIGGLGILPAGIALFIERWHQQPAWQYQLAGWSAAFVLPLLLALWFRRGGVVLNLAAAVWTVIAYLLAPSSFHLDVAQFAWFALFAIGLIAWGVREKQIIRINLGIAGFALVVLGFYFSNVMDKLGRSASLIGLGVLFLAGGWVLEQARRRLIAQVSP